MITRRFCSSLASVAIATRLRNAFNRLPSSSSTSICRWNEFNWDQTHLLSSHRDRVGCHRYNLVDEAVDLSDGLTVLFHQQHQGNWKPEFITNISKIFIFSGEDFHSYLRRSSFQNWCESCCNSFPYKASLTVGSILYNISSFSNISNLPLYTSCVGEIWLLPRGTPPHSDRSLCDIDRWKLVCTSRQAKVEKSQELLSKCSLAAESEQIQWVSQFGCRQSKWITFSNWRTVSLE